MYNDIIFPNSSVNYERLTAIFSITERRTNGIY